LPRGEIRTLLSPDMLREARRLTGLSQEGLARLTRLSRKTIIAVEREQSPDPDPRRRLVLEKIRGLFELEFGLKFDTHQQTVQAATDKEGG